MWLNLNFLTPCGEASFAFWLMALLSHQQLLPFRFDVQLNREISIIFNFGWIDENMVCDQTNVGSAILEAWPGINSSINCRRINASNKDPTSLV
jgi:hypothetical protein